MKQDSDQFDAMVLAQIRRIEGDRILHLPAYIVVAIVLLVLASDWLGFYVLAGLTIAFDLALVPLDRRVARDRDRRLWYALCVLHGLKISFYTATFVLCALHSNPTIVELSVLGMGAVLLHCIVVPIESRFYAACCLLPAILGLGAVFLSISSVSLDVPYSWVAIFGGGVILFYAIMAVVQSIAQRRNIREAHAQIADMMVRKDRFFAQIGHELRTPVNGIYGIAQIDERNAVTEHERKRAEMLSSTAQDLKMLLDDLLDHAKLNEGRFRIYPKPTDIRELITLLEERSRRTSGTDTLGISSAVQDDVPDWIWVDPLRVRQILSNLVSNAVKHTPSGRIEIQARRDQDRLLIAVRDTGGGIDAASMERLFTPFEQLDDVASKQGCGTGLGLSIARDLARAMEGDVSVCSTPDVGSTFTVSLPLIPCDSPAPVAQQRSPLEGRRIVVADDNRINRTIASRFLTDVGAAVHQAEDGLAALAALHQTGADALLLDNQMPGMTGRETLTKLRTDPALDHVAVIMSSAGTDAVADLADGQAPKPIEREPLIRIMAAAIERRRGDGRASCDHASAVSQSTALTVDASFPSDRDCPERTGSRDLASSLPNSTPH